MFLENAPEPAQPPIVRHHGVPSRRFQSSNLFKKNRFERIYMAARECSWNRENWSTYSTFKHARQKLFVPGLQKVGILQVLESIVIFVRGHDRVHQTTDRIESENRNDVTIKRNSCCKKQNSCRQKLTCRHQTRRFWKVTFLLGHWWLQCHKTRRVTVNNCDYLWSILLTSAANKITIMRQGKYTEQVQPDRQVEENWISWVDGRPALVGSCAVPHQKTMYRYEGTLYKAPPCSVYSKLWVRYLYLYSQLGRHHKGEIETQKRGQKESGGVRTCII